MHNRLNKVVKKASKQKPVPVKIVSDSASTVAMDRPKNGIDPWEARNALDTLRRAEEIKKNAKLLKAAHAEAKSQMKALSQVCKK